MSALPRKCALYLQRKAYKYTTAKAGAGVALVVEGWRLPDGKFDQEESDLLIELPGGYPDSAPDMFYLCPWLRLRETGNWPSRADVSHNFEGRSWQRWSRHSNEWRPGVDGIQTVLRRVDTALRTTR